jgi:signal transduction histidine kinase
MTSDRRPTVLIVDDDAIARLLAREALEQSGWVVEEADDGRLGVEAFVRRRPDLVLLDIMMPDIDGFAVCSELRRLPEGAHTPILIMTGLEDYQSIAQAYDVGATDFIVKPINGLLLGHRARYMLRAAHAIRELRESQDKLVQARDAALEGARLKSEFLATISHEIRTPMNGIIGMDEVLLETELTREQRDCAETIKVSANALLEIVNDMLDFSKLDAGRVTLNRVEYPLSAILEELLALFQERAAQKGLRLHGEIAPTVPERLWVDPPRLSRLLQALLGNAVKFTERGEVRLRIEPAPSSESSGPEVPGRRIRFSVIDTGPGISEADARRLFQPFVQVDGSHRRKHGGTGLGLALAKQLVELMGGTMEYESALGKGSRFWFDLPLVTAQEGAPSPDQLPRVLVLEADEVSQVVIVRTLEQLGCRVETARTVDAFMTRCMTTPWSLCLADVHLLDQEGSSAQARASAEVLSRIPLIGLRQGGSRPSGALPVVGYLENPLTVDALKAAVAPWISDALPH